MSSNVSTEEVEAILDPQSGESTGAGRASEPASIVARDFRQPRRMSAAQLEVLRRKVAKAGAEIESCLRGWLRAEHEVEVISVGEVDARQLVRELSPPFCVLCFDCAGLTCWAMWDAKSSVVATEIALGAVDVKNAQARVLSKVEVSILESILGKIVASSSAALGLSIERPRLAQSVEELAAGNDAARATDPQRVSVELAIEGPHGASTLRMYFAGIQVADPKSAPVKDKHKSALPMHLSDVPLELSAQLGFAELALSDLLGLEVGDVIQLGAADDNLLQVEVEGVVCASARYGSSSGRLAIRIEALAKAGEEEQR